MNRLEEQVKTLTKRVAVLEELEKRLALALVDVLPSNVNNVSGYEIAGVRTAMGLRWIWKNFLRGSRSAATFETREACVRSAQADSLRHIAFPSKDLQHLVQPHSSS